MSAVAASLYDDPAAFVRRAAALPIAGPACARGTFLVAPDGMTVSAQSAADNAYMDTACAIDVDRALTQHRGLQRALADCVPTIMFPGDPATPDAVYPNNVFATRPGELLIGRMRHPVRQHEAERRDIRGFFERVLGYRTVDLRMQDGLTELTGTLVIDRARGLGFAGLSPRLDQAGVETMHAAFGLNATLKFALQPDEYHTNVVMSVLASRALVLCPDAFVDPAVPEALARLYAPAVITLAQAEKAAFAGNCIAVDAATAWMSEAAADTLSTASRLAFERAGFRIAGVPLDEIEKGGGSLRCCVAEIF